MRKYAIMAALLLAVMIFCPLAAMGAKNSEEVAAAPVVSYSVEDKTEYITVMSSETGGTKRIEMREYLSAAERRWAIWRLCRSILPDSVRKETWSTVLCMRRTKRQFLH